jgi:hypothetical protein
MDRQHANDLLFDKNNQLDEMFGTDRESVIFSNRDNNNVLTEPKNKKDSNEINNKINNTNNNSIKVDNEKARDNLMQFKEKTNNNYVNNDNNEL